MRVLMRLQDKLRALVLGHAVLYYPILLGYRLFQAVGPRKNMAQRAIDYDQYHEGHHQRQTVPSIYRCRRWEAVGDLLQKGKIGTVLDVACGDGLMLDYLRKRLGADWTFVAGDISEPALHAARDLGFPTIKIDLAQAGIVEYKNGNNGVVDWIVATEVLEHLPNAEEVILRWHQVAREGVILSVPNTGYYPFRIQLLLGRMPIQWNRWPGEHLRFWTYRDFSWWLKQLGLQGESKTYFGTPVLSLFWKNCFADGVVWVILKK